MVQTIPRSTSGGPAKWAKVIDHTSCIGCHACTTACKSENEVPLSVTRTYVKYVDVGEFPQARRAFQVTRCNQCEDAPCVTACPTSAMFKRPDGIVDFAKSICIGCKACMAACPYDAIFINPEDHAAEKCNFCAHRLDMGLEPACVVVCPTQAILVGDLKDPRSKVSQIVMREAVAVRRPEKLTQPKLFYKGAHQATLDPLAARRPAGGLFMWSEQQGSGPHDVVAGHPGGTTSSAAALLSYDVHHTAPWDWKVSLYTWTKSLAVGTYLVAALLVLSGWLDADDKLWSLIAPVVSGVFLAATGGLLIWDLEHPERFFLIYTRPQWRSWLVRGAFIIAGFAIVLALHTLAGLLHLTAVPGALALAGIPIAAMTAAYTAYLFAQAKARDLWQNPLKPVHLLLQAFTGGAALLLLVSRFGWGSLATPLAWIVAAGSLMHLLLVWSETAVAHATAHAELAAREMVHGKFGRYFWFSALAMVAAGLAPLLGPIAALLALAGLMAHEHAYVQAGQSVPLA